MIEKFLTNRTDVIRFSSNSENVSEQYQKAYDIDMKQLLHKIEDKYQLKIPRSVRKRYLNYHSEKQNMMQKMNLVMKKR